MFYHLLGIKWWVCGCRYVTVVWMSMPTQCVLLSGPCVTLFSRCSVVGANKQWMRLAPSCLRSSQWSPPLWKRWWMQYGRCGALEPPFMTTSTPTPWRSASTPWRTSSPSTSVWSGCCPQACWYSSPTSSSRSSEDVWGNCLGTTWRRWTDQNQMLARHFYTLGTDRLIRAGRYS